MENHGAEAGLVDIVFSSAAMTDHHCVSPLRSQKEAFPQESEGRILIAGFIEHGFNSRERTPDLACIDLILPSSSCNPIDFLSTRPARA